MLEFVQIFSVVFQVVLCQVHSNMCFIKFVLLIWLNKNALVVSHEESFLFGSTQAEGPWDDEDNARDIMTSCCKQLLISLQQ